MSIIRYIKAKVEIIENLSKTPDPEAAHSVEDDLYERVLRHIAEEGAGNPAAIAKEALRTKDFNFPRWCA